MASSKRNTPELLAPAGDMSCLIAAVQSGADAVYFGGSLFNARRGAGNFAGEQLKSAVDYCFLRGVKTYVTLNTLLFDSEINDAMAFARELYGLGVTAVIVQDIGLAALLRRDLPGLAVHASTQMGVHNIEGLKYCESNGVKRAVLSREVSLEEIRRMHEASPVELEFFCHGALCMGFSGSCLYSSMAGERSGNRGTCAQPCRKNASVLNTKRAGQDEFCLSTNDICMIDELAALRDAGVVSLKIEGRMKQPEYVAAVTANYRTALDSLSANKTRAQRARFDTEAARRELYEIFNRGDFSTSHLYGDSVSTGRTSHAQPSKQLIARVHESMRGENRADRAVDIALDLTAGRPAELCMRLAEEPCLAVTVSGEVCQVPQKPVDIQRYEEQIQKLGGTVFRPVSCTVSGGGFIPVSQLNALRRSAAEELENAIKAFREPQDDIHAAPDFEPAADEILKAAEPPERPLRYIRVRTAEAAVNAAKEGADLVGIDPWRPGRVDAALLKSSGGRFILILPNVLITRGAVDEYRALLSSGAFCGAEANNIGGAELIREAGFDKLPIRIAGVGMNVMNSLTAKKLLADGFTHIMPSLELTRAQLGSLSRVIGPVMILNTYGRAPLMQLMHCPVKEYRGCQGCTGSAGILADGDGRRFPLVNTRFENGKNAYCLVRLMNTAVTDIRRQAAESGITAFAFAETPDPDPEPTFTKGHWARAVD